MGITIAIATHNRADELRRTLAGLRILNERSAGEYEVLVVGNRCTDHTARVVCELGLVFGPRLRFVEEVNRGLSNARNRAIAEARHEVIAFLDDDVDVDPDWLRAMTAAFARGPYAAVGGQAHLVYPRERPKWLSKRTEGLLTKVELGPSERPAGPDELYGVNLAVRKDWMIHVGAFRTDLGRVGKCLLGGEETELLARIARAGGALLYEPAAVVGHRVAPERLRRRWFWSRIYWGRRGEARMLAPEDVSLHSLARGGWRLARTVVEATRELVIQGPRSPEFFDWTLKVVARLGDLVGVCIRYTSRRSPPRAATTTGIRANQPAVVS